MSLGANPSAIGCKGHWPDDRLAFVDLLQISEKVVKKLAKKASEEIAAAKTAGNNKQARICTQHRQYEFVNG